MNRSCQCAAYILTVSFCCVLTACSRSGAGSGKAAEGNGPSKSAGAVSAADVSKVKTGMNVRDVEAILGKGEEATAPEGKGMPLGMWTTVDGESEFRNCTYRKWRIGDKTFVIAFFDGNVSGMFDGSPAVVEE